MGYSLDFTQEAENDLVKLINNASLNKQFKAVQKTLEHLADNPRHPGLKAHEFKSLSAINGEKIFEAYAQNNSSGAYRVFFYYPKDKANTIVVIAIISHPNKNKQFKNFLESRIKKINL